MITINRYINHFTFILYLAFISKIINKVVSFFNIFLYEPIYYKNHDLTIRQTPAQIYVKDQNLIPKNIFLCYKDSSIPDNILDNIRNLNPNWNIYFYDNIMCRDFIYSNYNIKLGLLFDKIIDGPIKADLFRICILYKFGGVYSDIDNIILHPLDQIIDPSITLGVGSSYIPKLLNPAFLVSTKNNSILLECIELYENVIEQIPYSYWDYSIVYALSFILNKYLVIENKSNIIVLPKYNMIIQFFKEDLDSTYNQLFKCMINLNYNLLKYYYLFDKNNTKIILLHNKLYDSRLHCFK